MRNRWLERVDGPLVLAGCCLLLATAAAHSQAPAPGPKAPPPLLPLTAGTPIVPAIATKPETKLAYVLGPDDQISVTVLDVPEISDKVYRIDLNGFIKLPLVTGRIQAAGLTVEQLEDEIAGILKTILKDPQVTISLVAFRSEPVSVLGSVKTPGVVQLQGRSTLVDVLSAVGGLADDAGYTVKIVRHREFGRIPLPSAVDDASGEYSMAEVGASEILEASNPAQNILICPHDEITVPRGEMIYVVGTVPRAGGFILQQRATLSVLQALSLAGGTDKGAATKNTKILRPGPGGGARVEVPVNLTAILHGKAPDVGMQSGDILFVPSSASKKTLLRVGDVAASVAGLMIYRLP
jgi:polysaccharide export outer membrane protein